ncbi:MAG: hypothetical protein K9G41_07365 [Flavobacteriales bacterium]|nr:hypothetical protein [Flavobacteriales bacterium]
MIQISKATTFVSKALAFAANPPMFFSNVFTFSSNVLTFFSDVFRLFPKVGNASSDAPMFFPEVVDAAFKLPMFFPKVFDAAFRMDASGAKVFGFGADAGYVGFFKLPFLFVRLAKGFEGMDFSFSTRSNQQTMSTIDILNQKPNDFQVGDSIETFQNLN